MSCLKGSQRSIPPVSPNWCDRRSRRSSQESRPFDSACLPGRMRSGSPRLASWSFMERVEGCVTRRLRGQTEFPNLALKSRSRCLQGLRRLPGSRGALSGLMPNIGGPRCSRRRLYTSVVDSVLLYGAPTWREATGTHSYVRKAEAIHRRACLRAICGFRSISHEAVHVLAGTTPPLVLLVDERSRLYERSREDARGEATSDERAKTLEKWQTQWSATTKGQWTHRLIPSIAAWIERSTEK
ncbi:unnamed protein product [Trichogramma brassicae]|uniref:Reverse transcriptase n=1 Tax=Trichogramma brassicae TaxID=86971 RepID=A0A6H5HYZ3_9HYME|nr:unnamed protein product [Trichogramma brassicae]